MARDGGDAGGRPAAPARGGGAAAPAPPASSGLTRLQPPVPQRQHAVGQRRGLGVVGDQQHRRGPRRRRCAAAAAPRGPTPRRGCRWARRPAPAAGSFTSARAIASRCCSPPDSTPGRRPATSCTPSRSISARARARASAPSPASRAGSSTFSSPVSSGSRWKNWNTKPTRRRRRSISSASSSAVDAHSRHLDRAGVGAVEAADQVQQGRFAATRAADHGHQLAGIHIEVKRVQHRARAGARPRTA